MNIIFVIFICRIALYIQSAMATKEDDTAKAETVVSDEKVETVLSDEKTETVVPDEKATEGKVEETEGQGMETEEIECEGIEGEGIEGEEGVEMFMMDTWDVLDEASGSEHEDDGDGEIDHDIEIADSDMPTGPRYDGEGDLSLEDHEGNGLDATFDEEHLEDERQLEGGKEDGTDDAVTPTKKAGGTVFICK